MDTLKVVRARCLYSKTPRFVNSRVYEFSLVHIGVSYDTYISNEGAYAATRLMGDMSKALISEGDNVGVIAVFEVC